MLITCIPTRFVSRQTITPSAHDSDDDKRYSELPLPVLGGSDNLFSLVSDIIARTDTASVLRRSCIADLRGDAELAIAELKEIKPRPVDILAIIENDNSDMIDRAILAGATRIIAEPFSDEMLKAQITMMANAGHIGGDVSRQTFDALTGLETAEHARGQIEGWIDEGEQEVTGMLCGIRRFENLNAAYGASTGDTILVDLAARLSHYVHETLGEDVLIARFGGRDFLIATPQRIERNKWQLLATELVEKLTQPFALQDKVIRLTARASLAKSSAGENGTSFIGRLTSGLSDANRQDAARIKWADRASDAVPERGLQLEADLREAIERDQIILGFQPQFSVETGALVGAEALAKWQHEDFGEIGAATLFAIAERTDFTEHLSAHIGSLALHHAAKWSDALSYLRLSLNVTAQQLASPRFVETQKLALERSGFDATRLTLEITESALIGNLKTAAELLAKLREIGIKIAIDDFGTGYSNFLYLKSLPLDYIKMDHAMTRDIAGGPRDRVIVRSIIALGQSLGLGVIAEGVESEAQLSVLKEEGCQYYQGFLRAKSMASQDFINFALRNN